MGNPKLATILRCTGLAILVLGVFALLPATVAAGQPVACDPAIPGTCFHGITIQKNCTASTNCNENSDCSDNLFCNGNETCSTISANQPHEDCNIRVTNADELGDTITLLSACDQVNPGGAGPVDCTIFISAVTDNLPLGDTTCAVNDVIGPDASAPNCIIGPGDVVTFKSNHYLIQASDPSPLPDQATIGNADNCDGTFSADCNPNANNQQFSSQTTLTNNCHPGTPPCTEDNNACTTITCNEDLDTCPVDTKTCPDDGNLCNGTPVCNTTTGNCDAGTPVDCSGQQDANLCDTESCDTTTGLCTVHTPLPPCADPTCTECKPATGLCGPFDVPPPGCVPTTEICRTPGFWGTHGGTEKSGSVNVTQAALDAYLASGNTLTICGQTITDTTPHDPATVGDVHSALEAICVSPKGDSTLQLVRQLTAAALNCIVTHAGDFCTTTSGAGQTADVCSGVSVDAVFTACNTICTNGDPIGDCIAALDCFNNGGSFDPAGDPQCTCLHGVDLETGECIDSCHSQPLPSSCTGPAGSPRGCNSARKDGVIVIPPFTQ